MKLTILIPGTTAVLAVVFALALLDQLRERRQTFQLVWAVGMVFFAVGSSAETLAGIVDADRLDDAGGRMRVGKRDGRAHDRE